MPRISSFRPRTRRYPDLSLETVLTDPEYFGLTQASPLQRAICRILDGKWVGPDLELDPEVWAAFGDDSDVMQRMPREMPSEFLCIAGIRGGKSLIAAACAVRASQTCDVSHLGAGDIPRVSVVSLSLDTARQTWAHIRGNVERSARLRSMLIGEPTADMLVLRHPSGRPIEIKIVAGARAAGSLVARWSAGVIFDEAPRMVGSEDGVVNLDEARTFTKGRLLDGAQILMIGSPFAPFGPIHKLFTEHWGSPSRGMVVCRAKAHWMNPNHWTPERRAELKRSNPDAHSVDVEANFLDPAGSMFTLAELERVSRKAPLHLPADNRFAYGAAIDPATRGNGFALVVVTNLGEFDYEVTPEITEKREKYAVVLTHQWVGSKEEPLEVRQVFKEIAAILKPYRIGSVLTDQWSIDTMRPLASDAGLGLIEVALTSMLTYELFDRVRTRIIDQTLELPPEQVLLRDLASVQKRVRQASLAVDIPVGADGRHADYAVALALAVSRRLFPPRATALPPEERAHKEHLAAKEAARKEAERRGRARWGLDDDA